MLFRANIAFKIGHRAVLPHAKTFLKAYSPSCSNQIPAADNVYYHGHLMADHLEYLDDMIDRSIQLQETVRLFKDSHSAATETNKKLKADDVDRLIAAARKHNNEIAEKLDALQSMLDDNKKIFAVDAPDGQPDWFVIHELEKVNELLENVSKT